MKFDDHFIKERTGHLEKISSMDYEVFFFCHLNWSIVNTDQQFTHECKSFADTPGKLYLFCLRASLNNFPIYYDQVNDINLVTKMDQIIKVQRPVSSVPISGLYHRPLLAACK